MADINAPRNLPIGKGKILILIITGAVLWLLAALLLAVLAPMGVYEGMARLALYALIIPGTLPFILLALKIAGLDRSHAALACTIMIATATLLDGIALAWFPQLYGGEVAYIAGAGGTILWGAGVALVLGLLLNKSAE